MHIIIFVLINKQNNTSLIITDLLKKNFVLDSIKELNNFLDKHGLQILKNEASFMDLAASSNKKDNSSFCNYSLTSK